MNWKESRSLASAKRVCSAEDWEHFFFTASAAEVSCVGVAQTMLLLTFSLSLVEDI